MRVTEDVDLAALAKRRDEESRDAYLSLFADLTDKRYERTLEDRLKEVRAALGDERAGALRVDDAWARARDALHRAARASDARGAAVFVSALHDFEHAVPLARPVDTCLVLDSSPYVRPLARYRDAYEAFVLVLLDGERAAVFLVDDARAEKQSSRKLDLIGRHKKGGWSQMRYQRAREGIVDRYLDDLTERVRALLEEEDADRIVVAGPGQVKHRFVNALPAELADKVIAVEDADFGDDNESDLVDRFIALAKQQESEASADAVHALRAELKKGELATTGAFPVARAARDGRVALLIVLDGAVAGARKCEEHRAFFGADATCPVGGESGTEVDLVEEAVEGAARSEARVEFVPDEGDESGFLRDVGGVGALLRW